MKKPGEENKKKPSSGIKEESTQAAASQATVCSDPTRLTVIEPTDKLDGQGRQTYRVQTVASSESSPSLSPQVSSSVCTSLSSSSATLPSATVTPLPPKQQPATHPAFTVDMWGRKTYRMHVPALSEASSPSLQQSNAFGAPAISSAGSSFLSPSSSSAAPLALPHLTSNSQTIQAPSIPQMQPAQQAFDIWGRKLTSGVQPTQAFDIWGRKLTSSVQPTQAFYTPQQQPSHQAVDIWGRKLLPAAASTPAAALPKEVLAAHLYAASLSVQQSTPTAAGTQEPQTTPKVDIWGRKLVSRTTSVASATAADARVPCSVGKEASATSSTTPSVPQLTSSAQRASSSVSRPPPLKSYVDKQKQSDDSVPGRQDASAWIPKWDPKLVSDAWGRKEVMLVPRCTPPAPMNAPKRYFSQQNSPSAPPPPPSHPSPPKTTKRTSVSHREDSSSQQRAPARVPTSKPGPEPSHATADAQQPPPPTLANSGDDEITSRSSSQRSDFISSTSGDSDSSVSSLTRSAGTSSQRSTSRSAHENVSGATEQNRTSESESVVQTGDNSKASSKSIYASKPHRRKNPHLLADGRSFPVTELQEMRSRMAAKAPVNHAPLLPRALPNSPLPTKQRGAPPVFPNSEHTPLVKGHQNPSSAAGTAQNAVLPSRSHPIGASAPRVASSGQQAKPAKATSSVLPTKSHPIPLPSRVAQSTLEAKPTNHAPTVALAKK